LGDDERGRQHTQGEGGTTVRVTASALKKTSKKPLGVSGKRMGWRIRPKKSVRKKRGRHPGSEN